MTNIVDLIKGELLTAGYDIQIGDGNDGSFLLFESDSILGFTFFFEDPKLLIERWYETSQREIKASQFALRRSGTKSWNTYLVLLAREQGNFRENIMLSTIEENLIGTRKIAHAGIFDATDAHSALLPLLAIQNAPHLEPIEMPQEIRARTNELPNDIVQAFLSNGNQAILLQLLEQDQ